MTHGVNFNRSSFEIAKFYIIVNTLYHGEYAFEEKKKICLARFAVNQKKKEKCERTDKERMLLITS